MPSLAVTSKMLSLYTEDQTPTSAFTSMFRVDSDSFHNSEKVEWDVLRSGRKIAPVLRSLADGSTRNVSDLFTNKEVTPTVISEEFDLYASDLLSREPGDTTNLDARSQGKLMRRFAREARLVRDKITRTIELMGVQIHIDGTISLKDDQNNASFVLDYGMKATHKITVGTAWSNAASDILGDLESACEVVQIDSKLMPDQLWLSSVDWASIKKNTAITSLMDNRRISIGELPDSATKMVEGGAQFKGTLKVGNYELGVYTYPAFYEDIDGTVTKYIPDNKSIVKASAGVMRATYGNIPFIGGPDPSVASMMPGRISDTDTRTDVHLNVWRTPDRRTLKGSAASRPLLIPQAIDSFATLTTTP